MKRPVLIIAIVIIIVGVTAWFNRPHEIKIGFVAGLSGKYSTLGHSVLNGVRLALEEVDYKVGNQTIQLIQKDDQQNPQEAQNIIHEFAANGVRLIIGNTTSSMVKESIKVLQEYPQLLMISPTASSSEFSNKKDNFLRTQVAHNTSRFDKLSSYLLAHDIRNLYMVYDEKNKSYVNNYLNNFEDSFVQLGGPALIEAKKLSESYSAIASDIKEKNVDAVVVIANSIDSSKFIQYLRLNGIKQQVVVSGWAKSDDFIENGGKYVEDIIFITGYDDNSKDQAYVEFVQRYMNRYGTKPSVFSAQAYETMQIILEVIKKESNIANLKEHVLTQKVFEGLQGKVVFDEFGDVDRDYFLMTVKNNQFVKKE